MKEGGGGIKDVISKKVTLTNKWGLHARSAFALAKMAMGFQSDIRMKKGNRQADAKRMDDLLLLAAQCGQELVITASGPDGETAVNVLARLIESGFGEDN